MQDKARPAPTLETGRLLLRAWHRDDLDPWFDIQQQPETHRFFGPNPMGKEECWRRLMAGAGGWLLNGFGTWAVVRKSDNKLIGMAGIFTAWRGLQPEFGDEPEMGWIFSPDVHGQGMAGEACTAVIDWAEATLAPTPIWAIISPGNEASFRLAERLGFERLHDTPFHDEMITVLRRPSWR